jgi:hypothetical protein
LGSKSTVEEATEYLHESQEEVIKALNKELSPAPRVRTQPWSH